VLVVVVVKSVSVAVWYSCGCWCYVLLPRYCAVKGGKVGSKKGAEKGCVAGAQGEFYKKKKRRYIKPKKASSSCRFKIPYILNFMICVLCVCVNLCCWILFTEQSRNDRQTQLTYPSATPSTTPSIFLKLFSDHVEEGAPPRGGAQSWDVVLEEEGSSWSCV
jgi:hypothetical protein